MGCTFCEAGKRIVKETKYWKILLGFDQSQLGRCVVSLNRHCEDLADIEKEELLDFFEIVKKLESSAKEGFGATLFNWSCLMNNAYQEPIPKPHVHWHFLPRYDHTVEFEGQTFTDTNFGHYYDNKRRTDTPEEIKEKIIEKLKQNL